MSDDVARAVHSMEGLVEFLDKQDAERVASEYRDIQRLHLKLTRVMDRARFHFWKREREYA